MSRQATAVPAAALNRLPKARMGGSTYLLLQLPLLHASALASAGRSTNSALSEPANVAFTWSRWGRSGRIAHDATPSPSVVAVQDAPVSPTENVTRSEERRVGKECRCRWSPDTSKTNMIL